MKTRFAAPLLAAAVLLALPVRAHRDASVLSAASTLPVASVVVAAGAAASVAVAAPVALSTTGAHLVVRSVEASGRGTLYMLERVSDGARVSVELAGRASLAAGTVVTVIVTVAGCVLSAAGEVIAFVPNAIGRTLMHNERLAY